MHATWLSLRRHAPALALTLLAGASGWAQSPPAAGPLAAPSGMPAAGGSPLVQLSATGAVDVTPDQLVVTLSVTREGPEATAVQAQVRAALELALAEARRAAQPGQVEVRTGGFGLFPRHGRDGQLTGWQGRAELVLEGRDQARIGALAGRLAPLTIGSVGFVLSREQGRRAEADAQGLAIERFRARATEVARGFGFAGYLLRELAVQAGDTPAPRPRPMMLEAREVAAQAPLPVEAGRTAVSVTVSGTVALR